MKKNEFTIKDAYREFSKHIDTSTPNASISVTQPLQHDPRPKWGSTKYAKPKYARFRAVIYYKNAQYPSKYPSWDYHKEFKDGKMFRIHSEQNGYEKLMKLCKNIGRDKYNRIDIYVNITGDLRVETHNYNDIVCKIKDGAIVELCMLLRFREDGKLDAKATMRATAMAIGENLLLKK